MAKDSNPLSKSFIVDFEPIGRRIESDASDDLLTAAQNAGIQLISLCGGAGSCDSCRIRLVSGKLTPPTKEEKEIFNPQELKQGYRLACQAIPLSDVKIDVPPSSLTTPQRLQIEGQEISVEPDPVVVPVNVNLKPPTFDDLRADVSRIKQALETLGITSPMIGFPVLEGLSGQLRVQGWISRLALRGNEVVAVLPTDNHLHGLAVDIGTTKLAAYLVDLSSGKTLAKTGEMNPQISYGEDVVSRIAYTNANEDGRKVLQDKVVSAINSMVDDLCDEVQISREQIVDAVVVGNTAMHHLFAGLPVRQLGEAPFVPEISDGLDISSQSIGLALSAGAYVHLPPIIAGYVGPDQVAMLLATEAVERKRTVIALDIGTNTEISLITGDRVLCCSCASGPAFEGAHIHDGMRAAPGAIERLQIQPGEVRVYTVEGQPAVGICGSGILDAISQMLNEGLIDFRGMLQEDHPLIQSVDGKPVFLVVPASDSGNSRDVIITRKDVNEIQLAKGAIRAGIEVLLKEAKLSHADIEEIIVGGAFGTYLDIRSAIGIGMFPDLPHDRFRQVGNAAGMGAKQMLISSERRKVAEDIARKVEYLELTTHPDFMDEFMKAMNF
ncbi:MAG: hypothetical protein AMJ88_15045 [Anaerolineae bacterium SM23_ 63]|nr:MAG: hypothetical protein AMJ88_15045 [Anaerolineae bacterium SM23_ 63]HEY45520.1 DUF4445 domain-containing protein [Anaerolineae bacterium]